MSSRDIQEYFDSKVREDTFYLGVSGSWVTGEITNLSEFTNLEKLEVSNSLITNTNLGFLDTLSNKEKLKEIDFSGNQIQAIDFAELFTSFPNLEKINLQNNPLSAKILNKLSKEQFSRLVNGIKKQKIKIDPINSSKKTISKDLLNYAQELIVRGENIQLAYQLQKLILEKQSKQEKQSSNDNKTPLLIASLIVVAFFVLVIGCWLKQKRKKSFYE